jgi:N-acetyl-gamma-glutamyl-phosphate reductase
MRFVSRFLKSGARVIDFSRDFRFSDARAYKDLFNIDHKYQDYLKDSVYGLPELYRERIRNAALVANPGCFSTAVILSLAPLVKSGLINGSSVIADIKAGLSGGGRAPGLGHHFPEANANLSLSLAGRDQEPEMEQELSILADGPVQVTFVPHTVPITRGILATAYCVLKKSAFSDRVYELYETQYNDESFVSLTGKGKFPGVKDVSYSNMCRIGIEIRDHIIVTVAALDNLGKGASGQAVQNMNIMFGFPETQGLRGPAMYP